MKILEDPRGKRSDELSFRADRALREGDEDQAKQLYAQAADLETQLAAAVPDDQPRLKSTLAVSAAALWMRSANYARAKQQIHRFLSTPDSLTTVGEQELEELLEQVRIEQVLVESGDDPAAIVPLNIRLEGGRVRRGLAPTKAVKQREATLTSQLVRVIEWTLDRPYRGSGAAGAEVTSQVELYSAPAAAASYGIRLFVMPGSQLDFDDIVLSPSKVVEQYLELAEAARDGIKTLGELVSSTSYLRSFATGFRDMAPDGEQIVSVTYASPSWRHQLPSQEFRIEHRQSLTRALSHLAQITPPDSIKGVLKAMDLTVQRPWIKLETPDDDESGDIERIYLDENLSTDELGEKLHRRVRVPLEARKVGRSIQPYALDVELVE